MIEKDAASGGAPERPRGGGHCTAAIAALAGGTLAGWPGLPDACTRADVENVLSSVTQAANESNPYSGPITYAPTPGAPYGLTVHYGRGDVEYITVIAPKFTQPLHSMLGEPEGTFQSLLEGAGEQWVYASLGLAFHMQLGEPSVNRLYVFRPTTLENYQTSQLRRVRTLRHETR